MSTVHSIAASDLVSNTRSVLTTNFANLNADKVETSTLTGSYSTTSTITGTYPTTSTLLSNYQTTSTIGGTYATSSTLVGSQYLSGATVGQVLASTLSTVGITPSVLAETRKYVYKSGNQSVFSSLLVNDDALFFNVGANEVWQTTTRIVFLSDTLPDFKYTFTAPAGTAGYFIDDFSQNVRVPTSIQGLTVGSSTRQQMQDIKGVFITSVAGSIQLQWAQDTHTPSSVTTMITGSNIIAERIN